MPPSLFLLPLLALLPLPEEETNPKGFKTPNARRAKLLNIEQLDWNRGLEGKETDARTYRDPETSERFKAYAIQNNVFRIDLKWSKDAAETTLLDKDGDGLFETRLPFEEAKKKLPGWVLQTITSPQKLLNKARIPVMPGEARLLQKSAIQRERAGAALPVVVLFFEEETKPSDKEAQFHASVAAALMMKKLQKEYGKRIKCVGFRINPQPAKQLKQTLTDLNGTLGSKVRRLPTFVLFTVHEAVDKKSGRKIFALNQKKVLPLKITLREEMEKFEKRLSTETGRFVKKAEK